MKSSLIEFKKNLSSIKKSQYYEIGELLPVSETTPKLAQPFCILYPQMLGITFIIAAIITILIFFTLQSAF